MIILFKYCVDVENCENFRDFSFINIYIYIYMYIDNIYVCIYIYIYT